MKTSIQIVIAIAAAGWMTSAIADDKALAGSIDGAAQQLATKDWRRAEQRINEAGKYVGESKDERLRAQYLFYAALTEHQRSDDPKVEAAQRQAARGKAISDYESYLKFDPKSGGALNNVAQLYAQDPEKRPLALQLYDRAIALNDPRASAYRLNKAALLAEMGQPAQALQASREVLNSDPRNPAAQSLTLKLLEKDGSGADVADYVRQLNAAGLVEASIAAAVGQIERRKESREPILIALVESMANPTLTDLPNQFVPSTTGQRLLKQSQGEDIGAGVKELTVLFETPANPQNFVWWRKDAIYYTDYPPKSRAAAMLALARALGDRCRRAGKDHYDCAERYYRFAIDFTGSSADPAAFLSLAEILAASGRQDELALVANKYERALFHGKGTALSEANKVKIFRFHLALGMMYGYLGKWTDAEWKPAGAVYQLQHALDTASEYSRSGAGEQLVFPPQAAALLSDGYAKQGSMDLSAKVRVDAAEALLAEGDKGSASELLANEWRASLPATVNATLLYRVDAARTKAGYNQ